MKKFNIALTLFFFCFFCNAIEAKGKKHQCNASKNTHASHSQIEKDNADDAAKWLWTCNFCQTENSSFFIHCSKCGRRWNAK